VDQVLLEGQPQGVAVADAGGAVEDEGIHSFIHSCYLLKRDDGRPRGIPSELAVARVMST
jgi:hypothetical protein